MFFSDCVYCQRLKTLEDKVQSVFDLLEEINSQQKYQTETDLKSLVNTESGIINIDHQALNSNKLKHFLQPLVDEQAKINIIRSRTTFELIKILSQIRLRVQFFFLYNLIDAEQLKEIDQRNEQAKIDSSKTS